MSSEIKVDTISEKTSAAGVTIDGVLIKDGNVDGVDVSAITQGSESTTLTVTRAQSGTTAVSHQEDVPVYSTDISVTNTLSLIHI